MVSDDRKWFTAAKWRDGHVRVQLYPDRDMAELDYSLMRSLGGPQRIGLGRAQPGQDVEQIRTAMRERWAA